MDDDRYRQLATYLNHDIYPDNFTPEQQKKLRGQAQHFLVYDRLLFKKNRKNSAQPLRVVKKDEVKSVIKRLHDDPLSGHLGITNTFKRANQKYYWPQLFNDIREYIRRCDTCQRRGQPTNQEELHPLAVGKPFDRVGIDLLQLPATTSGSKYVAIATDYLTKWVEGRALPNKTAASIAGFLYEDIICRHGPPKELLSDQGTEFLNQLVDTICDLFGTTHRVTTPYHPQTNGLTERFNRTLINILGKTIHQYPDAEWDEMLTSALFAYRTMNQSTTGYTPFYLLYGREAMLPLEFSLPTHQLVASTPKDNNPQSDLEARLLMLRGKLTEAQEKAQQKITWAQQIYKQRHDLQRDQKKIPKFKIGDQVLKLRVELGDAKRYKLEPSFDGPFYIHEVKPNGTYKLRRPSGRKLKQLTHGNLLKRYLSPLKPTPVVEVITWPKTHRQQFHHNP